MEISGGRAKSDADKRKWSANPESAGQSDCIVGEAAVAKMFSVTAISVVVIGAFLFSWALWKRRRRADGIIAAVDKSARQAIAPSGKERLEQRLVEAPASEKAGEAPASFPSALISEELASAPVEVAAAVPPFESQSFSRGTANGNDESPTQVNETDLPELAVSSAVETAPEIVLPNDEPAGETETENYKPREAPEEPARIDGDGAAQAVAHPIGDVTAVVPDFGTVPDGADEAQAEAVIEIDDTPAAEPAQEQGTERAPLRYRPPTQRVQRPPQTSTRPAAEKPKRKEPSDAPLSILVRLTFDRFGFCEIGLLPERTPELDDEVAVKLGGVPMLLMGQEEWYEDLHMPDLASRLRQGIEIKGELADQRTARWILTGRDLYALARHARAEGYVSTNRMMLGRSHVILCVEESFPEVEAILAEGGCETYMKLGRDDGIPEGWVGLRDVSPTKSIPVHGSDPFYAIKAAPDIEIELEGGVWLRGSVWLAGHPPGIKILGESSTAVRVLIDGQEAHQMADGFLAVDGYDQCGEHSVHCEGLSCSRSYSIEEAPDSWDAWPAFKFGQAEICGPLVQAPPGKQAITVPMSNPVLIGARPGEIYRCSQRGVPRWKGFVPFEAVWALPDQRCDKRSSRILQLSDKPVAAAKTGAGRTLDWSTAVRDASRKGLRIEPTGAESEARWKEYKKAAKNIWRRAR